MHEVQQAPDTGRRLWLYAAVAAAAAAGGGWLGWQRLRPAGGSDEAGPLWGLTLQTPGGQPLALASLRGKPLLVNFWATWCPPCVEEMPLLDRFYRREAGRWQVVGLAVDQPSAVRTFLQRTPVSFPIALAGLEGTELGRALGNQTGGLPFTVVVGADGAVRARRMGRVSEEDLAAWSRQA